MKTKTLATLTAVLFSTSLFSVTAYAAQRPNLNKTGVNKTVTYQSPSGTWTRSMHQQRTDGGFTRNHQVTAPDGRTAERHVSGHYDRETQTRTINTEGTRLNGEYYSGQRELTRTESGYVRSASRTNGQGETAQSTTTFTVDKEAGVATKEKTITGFNGETHTISKTIELNAGAQQ